MGGEDLNPTASIYFPACSLRASLTNAYVGNRNLKSLNDGRELKLPWSIE
jgi:hypothetical protein